MSKKQETVFRERFQKRTDELPCTEFFSIQQMSIRGTPDRLGFINTWGVGLEFKKGKSEKPQKLQIYRINRIRETGNYAEFVTPENADAVFANLQKIAAGVEVLPPFISNYTYEGVDQNGSESSPIKIKAERKKRSPRKRPVCDGETGPNRDEDEFRGV